MSGLGLRLAAAGPSRIARLTASRLARTRNLHAPRALAYPAEDGLGDFLPPAALKTVVDFQAGLLSRLNDEVKGTEQASKSVAQTVIDLAGDRSKTKAFNYASLALNNSFFLDFLKPLAPGQKNHEAEISPDLMGRIAGNFHDLNELKLMVGGMAEGMAGSGFVWLVTDARGMLAVLPTFASGTLLAKSRRQNSPVSGLILGEDYGQHPNDPTPGQEAATSSPVAPAQATSPTSGLVPPAPTGGVPPHARAFSSSALRSADSLFSPAASLFGSSKEYNPEDPTTLASSSMSPIRPDRNLRNMGETLFPLFCVSMHEHCWMSAGYGVWGKADWLNRFWSVLDWKKVSDSYGRYVDPERLRKGL